MKKINLSRYLKEVKKARIRAHIEARSLNWGKDSFLAKLFLEIEENKLFWQVARANQIYAGKRLKNYYNIIQGWYYQYSQQERGKKEYLNFRTLKWEKGKVEFNNFYTDDLLIGNKLRQVSLP